jgi:Protein of unknown function (DUF2721)
LLTAVGALLGVHTTRLARAVDRIRTLAERQADPDNAGALKLSELGVLRRRMRLTYISIALDVLCALLVDLTIVTAFVDTLIHVNLPRLVALLFVLAMLAFITSAGIPSRDLPRRRARSLARPAGKREMV